MLALLQSSQLANFHSALFQSQLVKFAILLPSSDAKLFAVYVGEQKDFIASLLVSNGIPKAEMHGEYVVVKLLGCHDTMYHVNKIGAVLKNTFGPGTQVPTFILDVDEHEVLR